MHQMQRGPWCRQCGAGAASQRAADAADDQRADRGGVAETQLGLCRVDVHVQLIGRQVEPQRHHWMSAGGDHVAIGDAHRGPSAPDRRPAGHSPSVPGLRRWRG